MEASSGGHIVPKIMTFRPTMDEFKDFSRYIEYIEDNGGHRAGVCKVIPPKEWIPRRSKNYDDIDLVIPAPIQQMITGCQGLYQQYNIQRKPIHVTDFKKLANSDRHHEPAHNNMEELERKYWKNITFINPLYGADTSGSLTDTDQPYWNINHLGTILDCVNEDYGVKIEGVNTAYLYFGMWKTTFGWHTEDMDLYSINYLHFGAPKTWYSVPPEHGRRLERLAAGFFPSTAQTCAGFMRHKMTVISPSVLRKYSIPFDKIVHYPGEFMITFPYGYHAGFNNGYNCAESTNFATKRWIEYGKRCVLCNCSRDMVRISMDCFVRRYQPDKYELWKEGKDLAPHPEDDQSKLYPHSGRGAAQAKTDLLELGIIGAEPEPRKRKVKAIDTGVVSKKRHPLSQEFGDIPTELFNEDSPVPRPTTTAKSKHKKSAVAAEETKNPDAKDEQNDKAMQDAVIAKIMASIKEQLAKKNETIATGDATKGTVSHQSPGAADVAKTLLQPTGLVHTVTTLTSTCSSGVNCLPAKTGTHLVGTGVTAAPSDGGVKNCSAISQGNVAAVSLLRPAVAPSCTIVSAAGIARQNGVQTVIADPAQFIAASGGQLHLIGNQLVCLTPASTVATSSFSSQQTKNLSGVVGTSVQRQPLQFSVMSQQVAQPMAIAAVGMTTSSAPFLSSVSSVESGQTSATDVATDRVNLTEEVVGGDGDTDPPPMPLDDVLTSDEYDVPVYSETMPADMDSMNATALEHAYFSSRTDVTPSQTLSQPATADTGATKKTCKRKEKTTKSVAPAKNGRDKAATKEGGKQSPKEDPKAKRIAELEELMADRHVEPWMREVKRLFQLWPHDMDVEHTYNETCAEIEPYCSVCCLFRQTRPDPSFSSDSDDSLGPGHCLPVNKAGKARCSQPLVPNTCFITSIDNQNPPGRNSTADVPGESKLLTCTECKICVHASCYGVEEDAGTEWMCDRCNKHQPLAVCCLCMLRGGALKPTTDGQWAHLVCALTIPEVMFEDVTRRGPVNVNKVPAARKKLRCVHCQHIVREHAGACAQCSSGRCTTAFHVTCAHAAGAAFEFSDWPFPVYISCLKHCSSHSEPKHRSLPPVTYGDTVIAKHKNGRYYKCQVIDTKVQIFYEVDFADGSFSHDLFPEDIVNFECLEAGPPPRGQAVQVRWPDGVLYDATFRGTNSQDMYTVEFEDGSEITLKRENIWSEQEELPKRVKSRISLATEMKHDIFSDENVSNKRVRRTTPKYSRD